ncbi:slipin family protein, partial [bacterium]|nr:slipin family protein [bacterium]
MFLIGYRKIRSYEKGLYFYDGEFRKILTTGRHWLVDPLYRSRIDVASQRDPWLVNDKLDIIVKSGVLKNEAVVLDLKDYERALVWIDGRFNRVLDSGLYALWSKFRDIKTEIVDARDVLFE